MEKVGSAPVSDRISELPDSLLQLILSFLPIKSATTTSILSRRWRTIYEGLWILTETLDFGKDFANQTREQFVNTLNRYLQLHRSKSIRRFRLLFHPGIRNQVEAEKWIEFATQRLVKDLEIDFCGRLRNYSSSDDDSEDTHKDESLKLPDFLFSSDSLTLLKLGHCDFCPPLNFTGFGSLESLCLQNVTISDVVLESILSNCRVLRNLSLLDCGDLNSIQILGPADLQLKSLLVANCYDAYEIDILAPNLKSFHFCGDLLYGYSFQNVSALEDVYISSDGFEFTEPEHDYIHILSSISHIKILTLCKGPLMYVNVSEQFEPENLPITFPNLHELQILLRMPISGDYLRDVYGFFKHTEFPCLEKIFIELLGSPYDPSLPQNHIRELAVPLSCSFNNLKTVKINNFHGSISEMKLAELFLSRAVSLELLVLVTAQNYDLGKNIYNVKDSASTSQSKPCSTPFVGIHDELLNLPKASNDARVLLCEQGEVDSGLYPTHTEYYCQQCCIECNF